MSFQKIVSVFCIIVWMAVSCTKDTATSADTSGKGGSLARFTISGNYLYIADYASIRVFDIADPAAPLEQPQVPVGFGIETIFPYKDKLFIGSSVGMFIYSIENPAAPSLLGSATHLRSCDPVVANDTVSYSTLQGSNPCGPAESGLYIYDIKTITNPVLKKLLPLSTPYGLGLLDSVVFVCRGADGLTAVNVKNPADPKILYTKKDGDMYMDVIPYDNL